jgi:hypothetical protein
MGPDAPPIVLLAVLGIVAALPIAAIVADVLARRETVVAGSGHPRALPCPSGTTCPFRGHPACSISGRCEASPDPSRLPGSTPRRPR